MPQQLKLADPSPGNPIFRSSSSGSRSLDTQSSISSISSRSGSEWMQADVSGQLTAVLMVMEMCVATQKSCCQFHASATLVSKLAKKLKNGPCDRGWKPNRKWQCSECTCLLNFEPPHCLVCSAPNVARQATIPL
eukprot:12465816-Heterocapsa_arctica.AAC.1